MDAKTKARCEARARVIKALAHPTRLFIVDELSRGEQCVCELTERIGADMSTVSKHLAVLKSAGLVQDEKYGTQVYYRLRTPCILKFLNCVESVIESTAREQLGLVECKGD
ncbi:MAG: metalloregulator ArsR/SmtB family transcription factor [bacterium]